MRVAVLASGSRGNALVVSTGGTTVLVDAGLGLRALRARARAVGIDLAHVTAVLVSHEHGDHARSAADVARAAGCPVYASTGTITALDGLLSEGTFVRLRSDRVEAIGSLTVLACRTSHDAAEPMALALTETRTGARIAITGDVGTVTPTLRAFLAGAGCVVVEANHDPELLERGPYPAAVRRRIAGPGGHLSNAAAAALVADLWHPRLETVVLAHLSERCNRPALARRAVQAALAGRPFSGRVLVASYATALPPFEVEAAQYTLEGIA